MRLQSTKTRRHRHVIDEHGNPLEDTFVGRLRYAVGRREDVTEPLPVVRDPRTAAARILPVHGDRTIAMRLPAAPDRFPRSFFEDPAFVEQLRVAQVRAHGTSYQMADQVNQRMSALVRRARQVSAAWRLESAQSDGLDLAAAYRESGTGVMPAITDQLAQQIVERAKAGSAVAS